MCLTTTIPSPEFMFILFFGIFLQLPLIQAYKFDILKKNSRAKKKLITQGKKLNKSAEKLKDLKKFKERRKKLKCFCCKNTFYQKSIACSYKKTKVPLINSNFCY